MIEPRVVKDEAAPIRDTRAVGRGILALFAVFGALFVAACGSSEGDELRAYLDQVEVEQNRFRALQESGQGLLDGLNREFPDKTWTEAARAIRERRGVYNDIAAELGAIEPPNELARAHAGLVGSVQLFSEDYDLLQQALEDADLQQMQKYARSNHLDEALHLRADWRTAVSAYAKRIDVEVPAWVEEVGTRG